MLELRPCCEHCEKPLPPDSVEARICSYECTFCAECVENVLSCDICPNCGGGLLPRPIRPSRGWKNGNCLDKHPASTVIRHRPVDLRAYAALVAQIGGLPPRSR